MSLWQNCGLSNSQHEKTSIVLIVLSKQGGHMAVSDRGFASMSKERQRQIASMGGKATAGKNLTTEARAKGGRVSRRGSSK